MIPISVINKSKLVTDDAVQKMTAAVHNQLAEDVAPVYGLVPALAFASSGKASPGTAPCYILDDPDVDGALGYHDEDAHGVPYIKVFTKPTLENGGTVLTGPNAVSVTLSHEVLELTGDAPANKWVDGPKGKDYAFELCDAVEGDAYVIDGVSVSNFLLPAFFDPKSPKGTKLDYLGKLKKPFSMTRGGYQIVRTEPGTVSQVFASSHDLGDGVLVEFGPDVPVWRRDGIANKHTAVGRRRGRS